MLLTTERNTERFDYELTFDSSEVFLNEYNVNLRHGGLFLPSPTPPPVGTPLRIRLKPPHCLKRFTVPGRVVYVNPKGAGVQWVDVGRQVMAELEAVAEACRQASDDSLSDALEQCLGLTEDDEEEQRNISRRSTRPLPQALQAGELPPSATQKSAGADPKRRQPGDSTLLLETVELPQAATEGRPRSQLLRESAPHSDGDNEARQAPQGTAARSEMPHGNVGELVRYENRYSRSAPGTGDTLRTQPSSSALIEPASSSARGVDEMPRMTTKRLPTGDTAIIIEPPAWTSATPSEHEMELSPGPAEDTLTDPVRAQGTKLPTWNGNLEITPVQDLMTLLSRKRRSGLLILETPRGSGRMVFLEGAVVRARHVPPIPELRLGDMLVEQKVVTREQIDSALDASWRWQCRLGQALVRSRAAHPQRVLAVLGDQIRLTVKSQLQHTIGRFEYYEDLRLRNGPPIPPVYPLHVLFRCSQEQHRRRSKQELESQQAQHQTHFLCLNEFAHVHWRELGLTDQEAQLVSRALGGECSLGEVLNASTMPRPEAISIIFTLLDLGAVVFREFMAQSTQIRQLQQRIAQKYRKMARQSPLVVLEIDLPFSRHDLKQAYRQLYRRYECSEFETMLPRDVVGMSREILRRLDEAFEQALAYVSRTSVKCA